MASERVLEYSIRSRHYLSNAASMLRQNEPEKAGELLWGALVEALKAVAAVRGSRLRNHREIRRYARDIAEELNDELIGDMFPITEAMHSNFYEGMFDIEYVDYQARRVSRVVDILLDLIPQDAS